MPRYSLAVVGCVIFLTGCIYPPVSETGSTTLAGNPCPGEMKRSKRSKLAKLQGHDIVAIPGEPVFLRAKLERKGVLGINPDIFGQTVVFCADDREIGRGVTNGDGFAQLKTNADLEGVTRILVTLQGSSRYWAPDDDLLLAGIPQKAPIIICDIDHTISDIAAWQVPFKKVEDAPPLPNSVKVLRKLSNTYRIVYLTARPDALIRKTRAWLRHWKFPAGPLIAGDFIADVPVNQGQYKADVINDLREKWTHIKIGIGDKPHDAEAYLANGLQAIILGRAADELPKNALSVQGWAEIERALLSN